MAAPKKAQQIAPMAKKPHGDQSEVEVVPDAWERFRSAVHTMTKAGPQHRKPKPAKPRNKRTK